MSSFADRPLLFAHRGARTRFPENTLPAFIAAIEDGANALELDVHVSSDGVVVVIHDDDGGRMCGNPGVVKDTPFSVIASWDAGAGFTDVTGARSSANRGLRVPRLDDVLWAVPGIAINIDVKPNDPAAALAVIAVVKRVGASDRVLLTSFHDDVAGVIADNYDGLVGFSRTGAGLLRLLPLAVLRRRRPRGHRAQVPVSAGPVSFDTRAFIDKMRALQIAVDYWVINDVKEGRRLLDLGADGIMTDIPAALAGLMTAAIM